MILKKRIVGFLLLIGILLIIIPLFFGRSIPVDELKLSARVPTPPPKPNDITVAIPPQSATVPKIAQVPKPATEEHTNSSIVFEELQANSHTNSTNTSSDKTNTSTTTALANTKATPIKINTPIILAKTTAPVELSPPTNVQNTTTAVTTSTPSTEVSSTTTPSTIAANDVTRSIKSTQKSTSKPSKKTATHLPANAEAWSVQLGSFSTKSNAVKLIQQLESQGFTAYMRTTKTTKGDFIRVLVGPYLQRNEAAESEKRIRAGLNIQGILVKASANASKMYKKE